MKDNTKFALTGALVVTAVVLTIKEARMIRRKERETRAKIANETAKSLAADLIAAERVIDRIREGKYDDGGLPAAMNDFKFEAIIARTRIEE